MIGAVQCVVLDCPDPLGLARFFQALLGGTVNQADPRWAVDEGFSTLHTEAGLVFAFQHVMEFRATLLHVDPRGWRVFEDPAGHPLCLLQGRSRDHR